MSEPFWCEELGKFLKIIPNEEADKIYLDVQMYCRHNVYGRIWEVDRPPEKYRQMEYPHPSHYDIFSHAIEVDPPKPEYDPLTSPPLTSRA
jgi:hypothetical protein